MEWYWILLIITVYLLMIGFSVSFFRETLKLDTMDSVGMALFWPAILPIVFGLYIAEKFFKKNESFTEEE